LNDASPEPKSDLVRLAAIIEILIGTAERIDGELVTEAFIADLYELRDRTYKALQP
jgi:hypothetical protein